MCKRRDPKGLYKKAEAGEIKVDVLGPPDEAQAPEDRVELLDPVNELLRAAPEG